MADWGGFSEAELRHLRSGGDSNQPQKQAPKKAPKKGLGAKKTTKPKPPKTSPEALLPTSQPEPTETKEKEPEKSKPVPETVERVRENNTCLSFVSCHNTKLILGTYH